MVEITINEGGPVVDPGVYTVTLTNLEGPRTVTAQQGPKAGQEVELYDWTFAIDEGQDFAGTEISASSSTASGPRSKLYAWVTALCDGVAPGIGVKFTAKDLIGRQALATVSRSESGWPRIENLGAIPKVMRAPTAGLPPRPAQPNAVRGLRQPAASGTDQPF